MKKYEIGDMGVNSEKQGSYKIVDHTVHLHEYLEMLEARNIKELKQLNTLVGRLKTNVNRRRAKLGLPNLD